MPDIRLRVLPASSGWSLDCDLPFEPAYFRSGARAEEAARSLGLRLAAAGRDVKVIIEDQARQVVATRRYFGALLEAPVRIDARRLVESPAAFPLQD